MAKKKETPVFCKDSEDVVAGRILVGEASTIEAALRFLDPADFFQESCKELLSLLFEMQRRMMVIDGGSILNYAKERSSDLKYLKPAIISALICGEKPVTTPDKYYIQQLKVWRFKRETLLAIQKVTENLGDTEIFVSAINEISKLNTAFNTVKVSLPGPGLDFAVRDIFGQIKRPSPILSNIAELDNLIGGFVYGRITVVGARPGVGKSAFASQVMLEALAQSFPCFFLSLEMAEQVVNDRMLTQIAHIPLARLKSQALEEYELDAVYGAQSHLNSMRYVLSDVGDFPIKELEGMVVEAGEKIGQNVKLLIVDYLQLLANNAPGRDRQQQIAFTMRYLTDLAKKLNLHVLAAAQLNRESDKKSVRPKASDLRESDTIVHFADHIILIHREKNGPNGVFIIEKNRHGNTGEVGFTYKGDILEFR